MNSVRNLSAAVAMASLFLIALLFQLFRRIFTRDRKLVIRVL